MLRKGGTAEQYRGLLDAMWTTFGRDRLIYGSNWPVSNRLGDYWEVLQVLKDYFAAQGS